MTEATLSVFEHTVQLTDVWIREVEQRMGCAGPYRAYQALRAVLHAHRDRLMTHDVAHFAAQLPMLVRGLFYEGWRPSDKPSPDRKKADFLRHVAQEFPADTLQEAEAAARAVFQVIGAHVSAGEVEKVKGVLPEDLRSLWPDTKR